MRPPDAVAGEHDDDRWVARAREAAERGPFGHHVHFTSPTHARPTQRGAGERVLREGAWLRERGLTPTLFCGGGWYTDEPVARACAELGYADCTPRATRPGYLPDDAAWAELPGPARIELGAGLVLPAVPTTHGAGDLMRGLVAVQLPSRIHAYFHDTDLVEPRRRLLIVAGLTLLGRLRPPSDLDAVAAEVRERGAHVAWKDVARGEAAGTPT
jgi:hypothetical protein